MVLGALTDQGGEAAGTLRGTGPPTQAHRQRSQQGTLPTPIVPSDEIDGTVQVHLGMVMAHEIGKLDALDPAILLITLPNPLHLPPGQYMNI